MAANPALVSAHDRSLVPAPFQGEHIALGRHGVELALDNVQTRTGKCVSRRNQLFWYNTVPLGRGPVQPAQSALRHIFASLPISLRGIRSQGMTSGAIPLSHSLE